MDDLEGLSRDALKARIGEFGEIGRERNHYFKLCAERSDEIERLRGALRDLLDAYLADVNPNDRNETAIEHARRNIGQVAG